MSVNFLDLLIVFCEQAKTIDEIVTELKKHLTDGKKAAQLLIEDRIRGGYIQKVVISEGERFELTQAGRDELEKIKLGKPDEIDRLTMEDAMIFICEQARTIEEIATKFEGFVCVSKESMRKEIVPALIAFNTDRRGYMQKVDTSDGEKYGLTKKGIIFMKRLKSSKRTP